MVPRRTQQVLGFHPLSAQSGPMAWLIPCRRSSLWDAVIASAWDSVPMQRSRDLETDIRDRESAKIRRGGAHFAALAAHNTPAAEFIKATHIGDLMAKC